MPFHDCAPHRYSFHAWGNVVLTMCNTCCPVYVCTLLGGGVMPFQVGVQSSLRLKPVEAVFCCCCGPLCNDSTCVWAGLIVLGKAVAAGGLVEELVWLSPS